METNDRFAVDSSRSVDTLLAGCSLPEADMINQSRKIPTFENILDCGPAGPDQSA
jgi:hypothetical protein